MTDDKVRAAREAFLAAAKDFAKNSSAANFIAMETAALRLIDPREPSSDSRAADPR